MCTTYLHWINGSFRFVLLRCATVYLQCSIRDILEPIGGSSARRPQWVLSFYGRDHFYAGVNRQRILPGELHSIQLQPMREASNHGGRFSKSDSQISVRGVTLNTFEPGNSSAQAKYGYSLRRVPSLSTKKV